MRRRNFLCRICLTEFYWTWSIRNISATQEKKRPLTAGRMFRNYGGWPYEFSDAGMSAFLENLALVSDQDTVPDNAESPTLLTLHAAKGLEFDQVFIIGLDDGTLPHSRSFDDDEEMAEERRLFYVGITRARNMLYLVRAQRRSIYGRYEPQMPSRFLNDVPADLVIEEPSSGYSSFGYGDQRRRQKSQWSNQKEESYFDEWDDFVEESSPRDVYTWERIKAQRNKRETDTDRIRCDSTPKIGCTSQK